MGGQDLALARAVAFGLIRNGHPRHVGQTLRPLVEALLRSSSYPAPRHEEISHVATLFPHTPRIVTCATMSALDWGTNVSRGRGAGEMAHVYRASHRRVGAVASMPYGRTECFMEISSPARKQSYSRSRIIRMGDDRDAERADDVCHSMVQEMGCRGGGTGMPPRDGPHPGDVARHLSGSSGISLHRALGRNQDLATAHPARRI